MADDRDTVRGAATAAGGFLWDGGENVYVYSQPGLRIRNIGRNPKVTFFRGDANGGGWSLAANIGVLVDVCVTDSPSFATAAAAAFRRTVSGLVVERYCSARTGAVFARLARRLDRANSDGATESALRFWLLAVIRGCC